MKDFPPLLRHGAFNQTCVDSFPSFFSSAMFLCWLFFSAQAATRSSFKPRRRPRRGGLAGAGGGGGGGGSWVDNGAPTMGLQRGTNVAGNWTSIPFLVHSTCYLFARVRSLYSSQQLRAWNRQVVRQLSTSLKFTVNLRHAWPEIAKLKRTF